jgi:diguanylate cyclase (GGDEF)-like protein/PAS domain S-box-containing protein
VNTSNLLLDASKEILILVDLKTLKIIDVNRETSELLGYTISSLIGLPIGEIECALSDLFFWDEVNRLGYSDETEGAYRCADGNIIEVTKTAHRVSNSDSLFVVRANSVTQRKQVEAELIEMSSCLSATLEATAEGILLIDRNNVILNMNHRFSQMWGLPKSLLDSRDDAGIFAYMTGQIRPASDGIPISPLHMKDADDGTSNTFHLNDERVFELTSFSARSGEQIIGRVHSYRDITDLKHIEEQLRIAATVFESNEGMLVTDANQVIIRGNRAFTLISGYTTEEVIGKTQSMFNSGRQDDKFFSRMWETIRNTGSWQGEVWNRRKSGEIFPEFLTITAVKDPSGIVTNYVTTFQDITKSKAAEDEIKNLAFNDPLTHLPNRRLLTDRLQQAISSCIRTGKEAALLFIDLDNFKTLNDTLGHDIGDLLLQQVAQRLGTCVREVDTVARLGGDEFVVILEDLSGLTIEAAAQTKVVGEKILSTLNLPYQLSKHECHNTPSIGVTLFNGDNVAIDELFKQADIAMYQAKKAGRNSLRFFDPQMQESINARVTLEKELLQALANQQFCLHYQIQVDSSSRPLGAEVLIRWHHPERGMVYPDQFIPLAEESGLILPIGKWVIETACAQLKAWQHDVLTRDLSLSVNVSAMQFSQADFVAQIQASLQQYAINPKLLKLELTESMLLDNVEVMIVTMGALHEINVQFSLDDFGTGYSSLQYLKRLPLDQLKIDQSFVRDIVSDSSDYAIVRTIIAMAKSLNLSTIAEGVETEAQRELLLSHDCTQFQGYLFSRPIPIDQFELLLKQTGRV